MTCNKGLPLPPRVLHLMAVKKEVEVTVIMHLVSDCGNVSEASFRRLQQRQRLLYGKTCGILWTHTHINVVVSSQGVMLML